MQSNQSNAPIGVNSYGQTTGTVQTSPFITVFATRDPTTYDFNYPIKQRWINTSKALDPVPEISEFILFSFSNVTGQNLATWLPITFKNGPPITSITGNDSVKEFPDANGNFNFLTENATVKFTGSTNTENLDFASSTNLVLGSSLPSLAGGAQNVGMGFHALNAVTTGNDNLGLGYNTLLSLTSGTQNAIIGWSSGPGITSGSQNTSLGANSLPGLITGTHNTAVGFGAGANYTGSESSNVIIANDGVTSESHTIRIGTQGTSPGQQNAAFMAGITGVTAVGSPVAVSSTGQLSDLGFGTTGQLLTSNGAGVSPTWQTQITTGGTFNLALTFNGLSTGITYTTRTGNYTIIGNILFFDAYLLLSSKGSAMGTAVLTGLPVTIARDTNDCFLNTGTTNTPSGTFNITGIMGTGTTSIALSSIASGTPDVTTVYTDAFFNATSEIRVWGFYFIS